MVRHFPVMQIPVTRLYIKTNFILCLFTWNFSDCSLTILIRATQTNIWLWIWLHGIGIEWECKQRYPVISSDCFQTMKILIVYQSVVDMCASFFTLLHKIVQEQESSIAISRTSIYDLWFFCRFWQGRLPLWCFLDFSTYGILLMACDRYAAVIYPIWYNNNVSPAGAGNRNRSLDLCRNTFYFAILAAADQVYCVRFRRVGRTWVFTQTSR